MKIYRIETADGIVYAQKIDHFFQAVVFSQGAGAINVEGNKYHADDVKVLAPCEPTKIVAVGLNYRAHGKEMNEKLPEVPLIFMKPSTAVIADGETIVRPDMAERVDYEAELGVVIKKRCKNIKEVDAMDYVLGFTCVNDVTARDLQSIDGQWTRAKGFDTFCPIGPFIETEYNWENKRIIAKLNGEIVQDSNTGQMIFPIETLVSFISHIMTLNPGDVIASGTPAGIGPMKKGDVVEVVIEGIGTLRNLVD